MKAGKITEPQCKRSVLKWLPHKPDLVAQGAGIGVDYSILQTNTSEKSVLAMATVSLPTYESEKYAFWKALNKLEASGAKPCAILAGIFLPARGGEDRIRTLTQRLSKLCDRYEIGYAGGHTELIESLRAPVITITAYGIPSEDRSLLHHPTGKSDREQDIVMVGQAAMETSMMILSDHYEELHTRYSSTYLEHARELLKDLSMHDVYSALHQAEIPVSYIHNLSTGGVYAGLWELGEACRCGIQVELKQIPILQETIEVCEYYDINPYMTFSGGSALIVTDSGDDLADYLKKHDIYARKVGQTTTGNDRIVCSDDSKSYLTPPKGDDSYKLYGI